MGSFEAFWDGFARFGLEAFGRYYSVYRAEVKDNIDTMNQGRIKISVPSLGSNDVLQNYAYPVAPFGAKDSAMFFPPDVGDTVYVMFENGNPRAPLYVGSWWMNPRQGSVSTPSTTDLPESFRKGALAPTVRGIETKSGHKILFDDSPGSSKITLETANESLIRLDDTSQTITIEQGGTGTVIEIDASGTIRLHSPDADEAFVLGTSFLQPGSGAYFTHSHADPQGGTTGPAISPGVFTSFVIFGE